MTAGLLAAEWTKIRSVRSTLWTLLVFVVVAIGFSALIAAGTLPDCACGGGPPGRSVAF